MTQRKKLVIEGVNVVPSKWEWNRGTPIIFINMTDAHDSRYYTTVMQHTIDQLEKAFEQVRRWEEHRLRDRDRSNWPGEG